MLLQTLLKKTRFHKSFALTLMATLAAQLFYAPSAKALTSGPVQPEVRGFEPVGTTDMVDPFTGDFVYNIPLLDVEGYPINISYHSGVDMEAEASWVGLGWSLNPGAVNKSIRGLPDDFKGETIEKEMYVKPENTLRIGLEAGAELMGFDLTKIRVGAGASLSSAITMSNYRGVSLDFSAGSHVGAVMNVGMGSLNVGMNAGVSLGSQTGAAINYGMGMGIGLGVKNSANNSLSGSFNANMGGVYNPRTGLRRQAGFSVGVQARGNNASAPSNSDGSSGQRTVASFSTGTTIPIGLENYATSISNPSHTESYMGRLKIGVPVFGAFGYGGIFGSSTVTRFEPNGSRSAYGYMNLESADKSALTDFSREKDGGFNTTFQYLSPSSLTYDVYGITGQGTGGSFRPYRNDIGSVNDPALQSKEESTSIELEAGLLLPAFEIGTDISVVKTVTQSGSWQEYDRQYGPESNSGVYEKVLFKEAGELTTTNQPYLNSTGGTGVLTPDDMKTLPPIKADVQSKRQVRANFIHTTLGDDPSEELIGNREIESINTNGGYGNYQPAAKTIVGKTSPLTSLGRKGHHVTEVVQTQKDGRRYVYGLPVVNNVQREVIFAIPGNGKYEKGTGLTGFIKGGDDRANNGNGRDNFYSSTTTPTYTTAHLLTHVLSSDYSDLSGDGVTDDDLGSFTKFNYSRKSADYRWRSPINADSAQYIQGFVTDTRDDKAMYLCGSREQWYLHSIESKHYIALFYTSPRTDAQGITAALLPAGNSSYSNASLYSQAANSENQKSHKLDSIVVFSKQDLMVNKTLAVPHKSVYFKYDYSLCKKLPNSSDVQNSGKLTLKEVRVKSGTSNYSMLAPYSFAYNSLNPNYNSIAKDRWGSYKPSDANFTNTEFPFVNQNDTNTNKYASAWTLTDITLPSGGRVKVNYESDDYAYVQEKAAMEMFKVRGFGTTPNYNPGNALYLSANQPCLYLYFDRRKNSEVISLTPKENYLSEDQILQFNVPIALRGNKYEPIKGYGQVDEVGYCSDGIHGFIKLQSKPVSGSSAIVSPVVLSALNVGRYSLSHIFYPGSDPDQSDLDNIITGMVNAIGELFSILENPLESLMNKGAAHYAHLQKGYMRLTSPGGKKKGGGLRVKRLEFFDNWNNMSGKTAPEASYGKEYFYTLSEPGKGIVSSGVASYEPATGGDEIPHRLPVGYQARAGNDFPPNDPMELFQETPVGESFFPSPIVGYRQVITRSIHYNYARSAQYEDLYTFYTAKEFPIRVSASAIQTNPGNPDISMRGYSVYQDSKQGFALEFNDMHGKSKSVEHYTILPTQSKRELNNYVKYEYKGGGATLKNEATVYEHNALNGSMSATTQTLGVETDLTLDSRHHEETTDIDDIVGSVNGFAIPIFPFYLIIPAAYDWVKHNYNSHATVAATKIIQRYGIPEKTIRYQDGTTTEEVNEAWDGETGAPVITSVNNEFNDREYTLNFPGYWAYKDLAPSYRTQGIAGTWPKMVIDTIGAAFTSRMINWPGAAGYSLPKTLRVGLVAVDEEVQHFNVGDEILAWVSGNTNPPTKLWVIGYTSDEEHCYLVLIPREPYKITSSWPLRSAPDNVNYKVVRSGQKNRLSESIQSLTTLKKSDILPKLSDSLTGLIGLQAQTLSHKLTRVPVALETLDSLNPFVSNKVGLFRPEKTILNVKDRLYTGSNGVARNAGLFNSKLYWKPYQNSNANYCNDSLVSPPTCYGSLIESLYFMREPGTDNLLMYLDPIANGATYWVSLIQSSGTCDAHPTFYTGTPPFSWNLIFSSYLISTFPHPYSITVCPDFWTNNHPIDMVRIYMRPHDANYILVDEMCHFDITIPFGNIQPGTKIPYSIYMTTSEPAVTTTVTNNTTHYTFDLSSLPPNPNGTGSGAQSPFRIRKKVQYSKLTEETPDNEHWNVAQRSTLYDEDGNELETEVPDIGFNSALYDSRNALPTMVATNAAYGNALFESFENYSIAQPFPGNQFSDYMKFSYSPFDALWNTYRFVLDMPGFRFPKTQTSDYYISGNAHTGELCLQVNSNAVIPLPWKGKPITNFSGGSQKSFNIVPSKNYVLRFWIKNAGSLPLNIPTYNCSAYVNLTGIQSFGAKPLTGIIEGWQQWEIAFTTPPDAAIPMNLALSGGLLYDDFKLSTTDANTKGFVYHPTLRKPSAILDENNFATFYEYDAAGDLVRTKKETERGIITLSESRSGHIDPTGNNGL